MKQLTILIAALLIAGSSFADHASKDSANQIATAWKNQQYMHAKLDKHDITIVYGGADISSRPSLKLHTTTV